MLWRLFTWFRGLARYPTANQNIDYFTNQGTSQLPTTMLSMKDTTMLHGATILTNYLLDIDYLFDTDYLFMTD